MAAILKHACQMFSYGSWNKPFDVSWQLYNDIDQKIYPKEFTPIFVQYPLINKSLRWIQYMRSFEDRL